MLEQVNETRQFACVFIGGADVCTENGPGAIKVWCQCFLAVQDYRLSRLNLADWVKQKPRGYSQLLSRMKVSLEKNIVFAVSVSFQ